MKVFELAQRVEPSFRQPPPAERSDKNRTIGPGKGSPFARELEEATKSREVNLSSHAHNRLKQRSITLGPDEQTRLQRAVDRIEAKGGRDALLLDQDSAFVVNVPSRTVVTAVGRQEMEARIFTNIDSVGFL